MTVQEDDGSEVLQVVLPHALQLTLCEISECEGLGTLTRSSVREAWVRSLQKAFAAVYQPRPTPPFVAIFGGKPKLGESRTDRVPGGIPQWSRWEFMHDIAVVEWEYISAAYAKDPTDALMPRRVPIVTRAIWQVESEISGNGTEVAEDASKLRVGAAENKLLIASFTGHHSKQPWLNFLRDATSGTSGNLFVALVPNYGSARGFKEWRTPPVPLHLYRCISGGLEAVPLP